MIIQELLEESQLGIIMSEVSGYLEEFDEEAINRISARVRNFIEETRNPFYVCIFDHSLSLNELDILEESKEFIYVIVMKYWCDTEEERNQILNNMTADKDEQQRILAQLDIFDELL